MKIWSLWIFGFLFIGITEVHGNFPENFVLAKRDGNVVLNCSTTPDRNVIWKFKGRALEEELFKENFRLDGQLLYLSGVEEVMLGEYSCWSEEQMLSSVYLLLEDEKSDSLFRCWAKSYNCSFNCEWNGTEQYTEARVGLGKDCTNGLTSCEWVTHNVQLPGGRFQFEVPHSLPPYTEETTMMEVTAEAITTTLSVIRKTEKFYLRDIIQPGRPRIVKCQEVGDMLKVSVEPPSGWSTPHSFFSLEHEFEYRLIDDGRIQTSSSALIPKAISRLRVHSRDSLVQSSWSPWSAWKNRTC